MLRMRRLLGTVVSFMREGLGSWDEKQIGQKAVEASARDLCATNELNHDERRVIGIRFTPDGSTIAVAGALKPNDEGEPLVKEWIEHRLTGDGTEWLDDMLVARLEDLAQ